MMKRVVAGLLIAPLWAPLATGIYAAWFWSPPGNFANTDRGSWIAMATALGAMSGYVAGLVLGLPTYGALQKLNRRSLVSYLVSWFAVAVIAWGIVFVGSFTSSGGNFALAYLVETIVHRPRVPLAFGAVWAVVGATFWTIVRPDRAASLRSA